MRPGAGDGRACNRREGFLAGVCAVGGEDGTDPTCVGAEMIFYHFTCWHGLERIEASGWRLVPNPFAPTLGLPSLVWLTDMEVPDREALGLTSHSLECDRTAYRLRVVETGPVEPWSVWCRTNGVTREWRDGWLEQGATRPRRWFVSAVPVLAELS